ncbi:MAG: hypothetical protein M5U01_19890 [Ardenticatenaceae bacterium]|nr:hypothetical protein [Ardenticatenaceae bacterium]
MFPQRFSPEQCSGERPAGTGVSLSLGLDRQIQARAARIGGPAGAGVSLSLGLDRQIQARPARVGGFEEIRGATHWAEMGRFWWWPPDLAIRRERVPLPWLGLDRQIQARPARVGDSGEPGATHWAEMGRFWWWPPDLAIRRERVPLPWLGLDRQIQARPARVGDSGEPGATRWAGMGRFWWWPPDLAIRRERVPLPWLGLDRQMQARPARVGGFEEIRGRAMIRRGPWRRHLGEPADKAGVGRGLTMAVNVSAAHEDVTSLSGKPPPGRGGGEGVPRHGHQGERATKWPAGVSIACSARRLGGSPTLAHTSALYTGQERAERGASPRSVAEPSGGVPLSSRQPRSLISRGAIHRIVLSNAGCRRRPRADSAFDPDSRERR